PRDTLPSGRETGVGSSSVECSTRQSRDSQQQLDNQDHHQANNAAASSTHQSSQQQPGNRQLSTANNTPIDLNRSLQEIRPTLRTAYESVYQVSRDGTTHESPATLRGVPVAKLTEDSAYWSQSWSSLDQFLAHESVEQREKIRSRNKLKLDPANKQLAKQYKQCMDNMSKHKKIREIFGHDSPYHPNQLINKRHMVSDFICLQDNGHLMMDPWDFIRWRLCVKLNEFLKHPGDTAKPFIRTAIYRLCDQSMDGHRYEDPIMRDAVLISADIQRRLAVFNKSRNRVANSGKSINFATVLRIPRPPMLPRRQLRVPTVAAAAATQQRRQARQERRAREEASGSHWQGINHYRAQWEARAPLEDEQREEQGSPPQRRPRPRTQGGQTVRREPRARDPARAAIWPGIATHRTQMEAAERARREREEHDEGRRRADRERQEQRERAAEGFRRAREEQDREIEQARQGRRARESPDGDVWLGGGHVFAQLAGRHLRERDPNDAARERADRERQARASESTRREREEVQQYRRRGYY
ncbi:Uncharacterized protein TPAR_01227, partial [Tolypocladium paradoxum]